LSWATRVCFPFTTFGSLQQGHKETLREEVSPQITIRMFIRTLWITALLSCASVDAGKPDASVESARCASRCLSLHITRFSKHLQSNGSLVWCENHKQCSKTRFRKKHYECVTSCEFLRSVQTVKQGECPDPERSSGFAAACVESCENDHECTNVKKCCGNGCGHTCQLPDNLYKGAPLKPRKDLVFHERSAGLLEVSWSSRFNVSAEPVFYVLQRRWNLGIQPSEDSASQWKDVAQAAEERVVLQDIRPCRWYQFRVAAVNVHGTRGFTSPSKHFRSSRDPSPPPAPTGLSLIRLKDASDGLMTLRLHWTLPEDPDLPIHHYKVWWSWSVPGHTLLPSRRKRRKSSPGDRSWVDLEDLLPNCSYTAEIQAMTHWSQNKLKSKRATIQFNTLDYNKTLSKLKKSLAPAHTALDVGTPYYQDGELQVRVYWKKSTDDASSRYRVQWIPEYCSQNQSRNAVEGKALTQENWIRLPRLLFSCKYRVTVQPIGVKRRSRGESTSFLTPSCGTLRSKSIKPIGCPGDPDRTIGETGSKLGAGGQKVGNLNRAPSKISTKAENLTTSFSFRSRNLTATVSWSVSHPQQPITGFRVTWAELPSKSRRKSLQSNVVYQSQILPPSTTTLQVWGLRPASLYRFEVQIISAAGGGAAVKKIFHTPREKQLESRFLYTMKHSEYETLSVKISVFIKRLYFKRKTELSSALNCFSFVVQIAQKMLGIIRNLGVRGQVTTASGSSGIIDCVMQRFVFSWFSSLFFHVNTEGFASIVFGHNLALRTEALCDNSSQMLLEAIAPPPMIKTKKQL
ncbi:hypothetical protein DNTS_004638, partial [Danionella cerebrum]